MNQIVDLKAPDFARDKYAAIEALRPENGIAPMPDGHVVFSQDCARWVMRCDDFRFDFFQIDRQASPYLAAQIEHELLNMHGHAHGRLQKIVLKALRDQVVDGLKARITEIADTLIDAMPDTGEVEFCAAFANPYPAQVLGPMYGIPYADVDGLDTWIRIGGRKVDALQSGDGVAEVEAANRNIHDYLRGLLVARRSAPGDDIFSALIDADVDGDRLSDNELLYLSGELASAGVDTTRSQLPLILELLLTQPDQLAAQRANPDLAMQAVDEGMRVAPLPWALPHRALADTDWRGHTVAKGDLVMVLVPAVNRDPDAVDRPEVFDITRARMRNFSFGYGMHACPGQHLARIEMAIALQRLLSRYQDIHLLDIRKRDPIQKGSTPLEMVLRVAGKK